MRKQLSPRRREKEGILVMLMDALAGVRSYIDKCNVRTCPELKKMKGTDKQQHDPPLTSRICRASRPGRAKSQQEMTNVFS